MSRIGMYASALVQRLLFGRRVSSESAVINHRFREIEDGVNYDQPVSMPGYLREHLENHNLMESYMREATANTSLNFQFDNPAVQEGQYIGIMDDPLLEWDINTREYVLSNTHAAYARNPLAKRTVHYISAFSVKDGFNLHCMNKDVERVLQEFIDDPENAIREYERQAVRDLAVDGELFLRFFKGKDREGNVKIIAVPVRPWEIREIHTEEGFFRRVKEYVWQRYGKHNQNDPTANESTEPKTIPADEMIHVSINKHTYELRGRPEIYPSLPYFKSYKNWLEDRARQNAYRGSLLWWIKVLNAVPGQISKKVAQYSRPFRPGSIMVTGGNEEVQALSNPVGAGDAGEDGRQIKLMALMGAGGLPEYMLGDGENANLASTKSQQLPALTTFAEFQAIMVEQVWVPTFKRVLTEKIKAGELPAMVEQQDADGDPIMEPEDDGEDMYAPEPEVEQQPGAPNKRLAAALDEAAQAEELVLKIAKKQPDPAKPEPGADAPPMPPAPPKPVMRKAELIDTLCAFTVDYEPLDEDDPKTLAEALAIAEQHEWISQREATTRFGADYTIMQKQIKMEKAEARDRQAQGLDPQPVNQIPPGLGQEQGQNGGY